MVVRDLNLHFSSDRFYPKSARAFPGRNLFSGDPKMNDLVAGGQGRSAGEVTQAGIFWGICAVILIVVVVASLALLNGGWGGGLVEGGPSPSSPPGALR